VELASIVNREQNALEAILFYEEALKVDSIDKYPHKKLWLTEVWEVHILFFQL